MRQKQHNYMPLEITQYIIILEASSPIGRNRFCDVTELAAITTDILLIVTE